MTTRESLILNIKCFIQQSHSPSQNTAAYINYYNGLNVYTSFGFGNTAQVTWISFTGHKQTTSDGIYPVLLYYRLRNKIILSYGISATNTPRLQWPIEINAKTIGEYFKENGDLSGSDIKKYKESLVYQAYDVNSVDFDNLIDSIDNLIEYYKDCLEL